MPPNRLRRLSKTVRSANWLLPFFLCLVSISLVSYGLVGAFALPSVGMAMATLLLLTMFTRDIPRRLLLPVMSTCLLLALLVLWVLFQAFDQSTPGNAAWSKLSSLNFSYSPRISIAPADTVYAIQALALPYLTFLTSMLIGRNESERRLLVRQLGWVGTIVVSLSFIQFLVSNDYILTRQKQFYPDSFTSFFVNRNNAGTFIGLALLINLRQLWSVSRPFSAREIGEFVISGHATAGRRPIASVIYAALLFVLLIALFMTKSRGAIVASLISASAFMSFLLWLRWRARGNTRPSWFRFASGLLILLVVIVLVFALFGGRVAMRARILGADDPRFCVMPGILRLAADSWPFGTGAGTFAYAFAPYRDPACGLNGIWQKAHNSYLQSIIELGAPGTAILGLTLAIVAVVLVRNLITDQRQRSYAALALSALALLAMHSLVDFSAEIPAVALYFSALIGSCTALGAPGASRPAS